MKFHVDRKLAIPIRQQLRSAIEHEISFGSLAAGSPLPSVRELAEQAGVAPMTVSNVYAELKARGMIEGRVGSGTFVADSSLATAARRQAAGDLRHKIDALIDHALDLGIGPADVMAMVSARVVYREGSGARKRIAMIGLFADATASYADCVANQVGHLATVESATLGAIRADEAALARVRAADLVLTFANLQDDVKALVPGIAVLSLRFIPSEATRMALASLDPMARVAVVSRFPDFLPILTLGVRRFAAHVQSFAAINMDDPDLDAALAGCDVLVLATGADAVAQKARPDALRIEYRHIPDPGDIDRQVIPFISNTAETAARGRKEAS